jgi:putative transposase
VNGDLTRTSEVFAPRRFAILSLYFEMNSPFEPEKQFHVFNRAVGSERLFRSDENYFYFLERVKEYILPIADIQAYCLLPNHFHFLFRFKTEGKILAWVDQLKREKRIRGKFHAIDIFILQQFSNLGNAYTKAFNKVHRRKGRLFMESLKRKEVASDNYLTSIVHYIHANPVHHGLVPRIEDWKYSSYRAYLSDASTLVQRGEILEWFGGTKAFIEFHQQPIYLKLDIEP